MTRKPEPTDTDRTAEDRWLAWRGMLEDDARELAQVPDEHLIGDARSRSTSGAARSRSRARDAAQAQGGNRDTNRGTGHFPRVGRGGRPVIGGGSPQVRGVGVQAQWLTRWLIGFTVTLVVLTVAVLALTAGARGRVMLTITMPGVQPFGPQRGRQTWCSQLSALARVLEPGR